MTSTLGNALLPMGTAMGWDRRLVTLHVFSDAVIAASYIGVAVILLLWMLQKKNGMPFPRTFALFAVVSLLSGFVHLSNIIILWQPLYWTDGAVKVATALASMGMALCFPFAMRQILSLLRASGVAEERKQVIESRNDALLRMNETLEQEISVRKRVEDRDHTNIQRLQSTLDSLPFAAVVIDERDMLIHANHQCCDVLGLQCSPEEIVGLHSDAYFDRVSRSMEDPVGYLHGIQQMLAQRERLNINDLRLRNGRVVRREFVPILSDGQPRGCLVLYRDITKEQRIDASKSEFMSLASHQLRTPLTAIRWSLGRLGRALAGKITSADAVLINEGKIAATRMAHTIDTMLAISRIEAGQIRVEPSDVKLGALLNDVRVDCREMSETKQQSVLLDCPPNLVISTDPHILTEILQNLYTNAIKYTPAQGHIHIRGSLLDGIAQIEVEDDGYGIPAHQQQKIFRKFFRADNITNADTEGTGLGLYLVSLLVQMLHGDIRFVSSEGTGTTFILTIPSHTYATSVVPLLHLLPL